MANHILFEGKHVEMGTSTDDSGKILKWDDNTKRFQLLPENTGGNVTFSGTASSVNADDLVLFAVDENGAQIKESGVSINNVIQKEEGVSLTESFVLYAVGGKVRSSNTLSIDNIASASNNFTTINRVILSGGADKTLVNDTLMFESTENGGVTSKSLSGLDAVVFDETGTEYNAHKPGELYYKDGELWFNFD